MSLAIRVVDSDGSEDSIDAATHELRSCKVIGSISASHETSARKTPRTERIFVGGNKDDKAHSLNSIGRNDSACAIVDERRRIVIITSPFTKIEDFNELREENNVRMFRASKEGLDLVVDEFVGLSLDSSISKESLLADADYYIFAISTAVFLDRTIDESALELALESTVKYAKRGATIIIESTVLVGTTRRLLEHIMKSKDLKGGISPKLPQAEDYLTALHYPVQLDSFKAPKLVAGLDEITPGSLASIYSLYSSAFPDVVPVSSTEIAEMATLYESGQRMIAVAYANEMGDASAPVGIDPFEVCSRIYSRSTPELPPVGIEEDADVTVDGTITIAATAVDGDGGMDDFMSMFGISSAPEPPTAGPDARQQLARLVGRRKLGTRSYSGTPMILPAATSITA